jgi:uncharacterized membrane protein YadS
MKNTFFALMAMAAITLSTSVRAMDNEDNYNNPSQLQNR